MKRCGTGPRPRLWCVLGAASAVSMVGGLAACAPRAEAGAEGSAPDGWQVLFDGSDLSAWRGFEREAVPAGWSIEEGVLTYTPGVEGGDLVTRDAYGDFELELEWRISPGGNSGILFHVVEGDAYDAVWETGPEYQVLDNAGHSDGEIPEHTAGSNFALHAPSTDATRPVGEWNQTRLVVRGPHVEHWLNGVKVVEYERWTDEWTAMVAATKFDDMPGYGMAREGHIALQDHGDPVAYRAIRIRRPGV